MVAKFHERFEIDVGVKDARRRFAARVANLIFQRFVREHFDNWGRFKAAEYVASVLGDPNTANYLDVLAGTADFHRHLQAVEALYAYAARDDGDQSTAKRDALTAVVREILAMSEIDIGVRWQATGRFLPEGAGLLDDKLVNDPLRWLKVRGYDNVLNPYQKGLQHFLQSQKNPALLSDVVTDIYEALEALAKIVTGRDADLSANQELLMKKVKASDSYKRLLKVYIDYANDFRHAAEQGTVRPTPAPAEVENFVYLTGIFIRLAMA